MSKELSPLEELENIKRNLISYYEMMNTAHYECPDTKKWVEKTFHFDIIETALKRLEQIDNATVGVYEEVNKKLKVLEIIKEKRVNVDLLYFSKNVSEYNENIHSYAKQLTQEEFDLLKEELL